MRSLLSIVACILAAAVVPTVAAAGAVQFSGSWTNEPTSFYFGDFCTGPVAGNGTQSGTVRVTETPSGGWHVRGQVTGSIALYEVTGPPWDPQFGAYVGTWTYSGRFDEQEAGGGQESAGSTSGGPIVYADGTVAHYQQAFRIVFPKDGPPRLFFVQDSCGGVG